MYQSKLDRARQGVSGALADVHNATHGLYLMALSGRSGTYAGSYTIGMRIYTADQLFQIILEATTYLGTQLEATNEEPIEEAS
jgi:hypothetical protein